MNRRFLFVLILLLATFGFAQGQASGPDAQGVLKDSRDGQEYKTVKIGDAVWMAENLNFEVEESWCYTRFNYECRKYGRFYNWDVAQNVCPEGWHLPTAEEFDVLIAAVGGKDSAGVKLKSSDGWSHYGNGTDEYGFNATPSGFRDYRGRFDRQTLYAYLWSATEDSATSKKAMGVHMMAGRNDVSVYPYAKDFGLSVRCVKNKE